jgi:hypothetical protein
MKSIIVLTNPIKKNLLWVFVLSVLCLIQACGGGGAKKGGISAAHVKIPADVSFVVSIDVKAMKAKVKDLRNVFDEESMKSSEMSEEDRKIALQIVESLDDEHKVYIFGKTAKDKKGNYVAVSFLLKDPKKFEEAFSKMKKAPQIKTEGKIKLGVKDEGAIGWEDKKGLFMFTDNGEGNQLGETFKKIFTGTETLKNDDFAEMEGAGYDIGGWMDFQKVMEVSADTGYEEMMAATPFAKDAAKLVQAFTIGAKFENGQMVIESNAHLNKDVSGKFEKMMLEGIHDKILKSIPISAPSAMLGYSLGMSALYDYLKDDKNFTEGLEMQLSNYDMKPKDIFDMLDGDIVLATGDLKLDKVIGGEVAPELTLAVGINQKDKLNKLMKGLVKSGALTDRGNGLYVSPVYGDIKAFVLEKNNVLYVTMTEGFKDAILKGKGGMDGEHNALAKNNSSVLYLDLKKIYSQLPANYTESVDGFEYIKAELKEILISSETIKNHKIGGKFILRLQTKDKNALLALAEMTKKINKAQKERKPTKFDDVPDMESDEDASLDNAEPSDK